MAADEYVAIPVARLDRLGEIDDLGNVGKIIQREADRLWAKRAQLAMELCVAEGLQIDDADIVPGHAHGLGNTLQSQRLEPKENLAVH